MKDVEGRFKHWEAKREAFSLIIQVLARSIVNNASPEDAAAGCPIISPACRGIRVDRAKRAAIGGAAGPSELRETRQGDIA